MSVELKNMDNAKIDVSLRTQVKQSQLRNAQTGSYLKSPLDNLNIK